LARRRLSPEDRRQAILQAAVEAFDDGDPDQVNLEAVAERAGVSRALLYTYFENRQGVLRAVFEHVLADLAGELRAAVLAADGAEQQIGNWVVALAGYARTHPNRWQVIRRSVLSPGVELGGGLGALLRHLAVADGWIVSPLALTALVGMVDWTADQLDEQGAAYLARLAWVGTSGLATAEVGCRTEDGLGRRAVDNIGNSQGCSSGLPQAGRPTVESRRSEG
jgi:AcrR family transcriptional regulator